MAENQTKSVNKAKTKLVLDVLIFVAFLVAMQPRASGLAVHEWLTLSAVAVITVHLLLSWDWIVQVTRRFLSKANAGTRLNYLLNWTMFVDVILIMLSGIMISEVAMPALGINLGRNFAWRGLHSLSTNLFLVLFGLHTALHWGWIVNAFKRYVFQPIGRVFTRGDSDSDSTREDMTA